MTDSAHPNDPFLLMLRPDIAVAAANRSRVEPGRLLHPLETVPLPPGGSFQKADPIGAWYRAARAQKPGRTIRLDAPPPPSLPEPAETPPVPDVATVEKTDQSGSVQKKKKANPNVVLWQMLENPVDTAMEKFRLYYLLEKIEQCGGSVPDLAREIEMNESFTYCLLRGTQGKNPYHAGRNNLRQSNLRDAPSASTMEEFLALPYKPAMASFSKHYLTYQFKRADGNVSRMAEAMDRTTGWVRKGLKEAGIDKNSITQDLGL